MVLGMTEAPDDHLARRYARQIAFGGLAGEGQRRLAGATALLVGVGGLGSWTAALLARAGVGRLRLVDADRVEAPNLHRQALYTDADADAGVGKARAATARLRQINADVTVECVEARLDAGNVAELADGADVICDGTDNFATRFVLNDYAVREGRPWVFAGAVGAEGQVLAVLPGRTACLRCLYDCPPDAGEELAPVAAGVLGPGVATVSGILATEAMKVLAGRLDAVQPRLTRIDLWKGTFRRIAAGFDADPDCICCKQRRFEHLGA